MSDRRYIPPPKFITPPAEAGGLVCRTLQIPDDKLWLGVFNKALLELAYPERWEHNEPSYLSPEQAAAACYAIFEQYLASEASCETVPAPYWDIPSRADDMAEPASQPWYGLATVETGFAEGDITFVQQLGIWGITAFIAYSGAIGGAVAFATFAPRFVLAWNKSGVGGAIRVLIDGIDQGLFDTHDEAGGVLEQEFYADEEIEEHEIIQILETKPEGAPDEPTSAEEAAMQIIRKRLTEVEVDVITDIRQVAASGQLEMERAGEWLPVPTAENVRRDGSVAMSNTFLLDKTAQPGDAAVSPTISTRRRSVNVPANGDGQFWGMNGETATSHMIRSMYRQESRWEIAADATRRALIEASLFDFGGMRLLWRGGTNGSAPMLGFLGAAAVLRQVVTGERDANPALASLLTGLANLGLITDTSTVGTHPADGAPGAPGAPGADGADGADGEDGAPGTPATTPISDLPPEGSIPEGECVGYDLILNGNGQVLVPVVLQGGYTVQISELTGAASDQLIDIDAGFPADVLPNWYCPDGHLYILGGCAGDSPFEGADPLPAARHMVLIASVNGALFDCSASPQLVVGEGVSDVLLVFQLNDSDLSDNQGQIRFHVEICNPGSPEYCIQIDDAGSAEFLGDNRWRLTAEFQVDQWVLNMMPCPGETNGCFHYTELVATVGSPTYGEWQDCSLDNHVGTPPSDTEDIHYWFLTGTAPFTIELNIFEHGP